jgi:hypothetical protein
MDKIFETIRDSTNDYSKKISVNKYTQDIYVKQDKPSVKYFDSIYECLLSQKDVPYQILNDGEKPDYVKQHLLELCNTVDSEYDTYNFNKKVLSKQKLCRHLQGNKNVLSSILFYNEYFKVNLIIMNESTGKLYKTGLKDYDKLYISCSDKKWVLHESVEDSSTYSDIGDLSSVIEIDMKDNFVYNTYLKAISNYKADDLTNIANELNVSLIKDNGKKKTKKELYDEINLNKM